jgi:hypothetical protein
VDFNSTDRVPRDLNPHVSEGGPTPYPHIALCATAPTSISSRRTGRMCSDVQKRCLPPRAGAGPESPQGPEPGLTASGTDSNPHETDLNPHGLVITLRDRSHMVVNRASARRTPNFASLRGWPSSPCQAQISPFGGGLSGIRYRRSPAAPPGFLPSRSWDATVPLRGSRRGTCGLSWPGRADVTGTGDGRHGRESWFAAMLDL